MQIFLIKINCSKLYEMLYQSNRKSLSKYLDFDAFLNMLSWLRKKIICSEISLWFYHEHSRTTKREVIFKLSKDAFRNTHVFHGHWTLRSVTASKLSIWFLICVLCLVCMCAQSCLTLSNPMDCSPPGSSVHGTSLARILEWVAISFSWGSSWLRDCIDRWILLLITIAPPGKPCCI